jgi:hypothetical protein
VRAALLLALLAAGCASERPQSADELRKAVVPSKWDRVDVQRPHADVVKSLQQNAQSCLNRQVEGATFKSTMVSSKRRAELHVERSDEKGAYYVFVVDVTPTGKGTRLQLNFVNDGYDSLVRAVIAWARGGRHNCPDLGKGK